MNSGNESWGAQAACRAASIPLGHFRIWFQLAKMRLDVLPVALRAVAAVRSRRSLRACHQVAVDEFEVFNRWKWIVEMMQ
jgi:hypothetical protein